MAKKLPYVVDSYGCTYDTDLNTIAVGSKGYCYPGDPNMRSVLPPNINVDISNAYPIGGGVAQYGIPDPLRGAGLPGIPPIPTGSAGSGLMNFIAQNQTAILIGAGVLLLISLAGSGGRRR